MRTLTATLIAVAAFLFVQGDDIVSADTDPMSQDAFPCHEDQWLGFDPSNTERVVCIDREG